MFAARDPISKYKWNSKSADNCFVSVAESTSKAVEDGCTADTSVYYRIYINDHSSSPLLLQQLPSVNITCQCLRLFSAMYK